ncbi:MAG: twin-arginine translocase TatA/TatE family subunit [Chakrabartia sp.]
MPSWQHLLILGLVVIVLFGKGRISEMMGDFGKGIKSFKKGLAEEDGTDVKPAQRIEGQATPLVEPEKQTDKTV